MGVPARGQQGHRGMWKRDRQSMPLDAFYLLVVLDTSDTLSLIFIASQIPQTADGDTEAHSSSLPNLNMPPCIGERERVRRLRRRFKGSTVHMQTPLTRADERRALYWLVLASSHPPCATFTGQLYKILFFFNKVRLKLTCQVQMIMFTFSVRNIPPHQSPREHEAFKDNFLGVNYFQEPSSHHETSKLPGVGGRGADFTFSGSIMRPIEGPGQSPGEGALK